MENKPLNEQDLKEALCDVRKAHRLIYHYQRRMLDLTHFIKSKLNFENYRGNRLFCHPIKTQYPYGTQSIRKDMWAWDFLYSYTFEYYLGIKKFNQIEIEMSLVQVSDTGFYDKTIEEEIKGTDLKKFNKEENASSKLIFILEERSLDKEGWNNDNNWESILKKEKCFNKLLSKEHEKYKLDYDDRKIITYSFPIEKFLNERTTIEILEEFIKYCNNNGIKELELLT